MTNKLLTMLCMGALMVGCNNNDTVAPASGEDNISKDSAMAAIAGCYESVNNQDTISMSLKVKDDNVTGTLSFNLMEKDKNIGSIEGKIIGDTVFAHYKFMSEGTESFREVVFVKKGNALVQGFGPVDESNGKVVFKKRSALVFEDANTLTKTPCPPTP